MPNYIQAIGSDPPFGAFEEAASERIPACIMHETHCEFPASFKKVSEIRRTDGRERTHEIRFWICMKLGTSTDFLEWRAERSKHIHEKKIHAAEVRCEPVLRLNLKAHPQRRLLTQIKRHRHNLATDSLSPAMPHLQFTRKPHCRRKYACDAGFWRRTSLGRCRTTSRQCHISYLRG